MEMGNQRKIFVASQRIEILNCVWCVLYCTNNSQRIMAWKKVINDRLELVA
jgi:hypothetical protein